MSVTHNSALTTQVPPPESGKGYSPDSLAELLQQMYTQQYVEARNQYKASHARFTGRVKRLPPSSLDLYCEDAVHNLSWYTSAINSEEACAPLECTHGPRRVGLHSLNYELRSLAQQRLLAAPPKVKPTAYDIAALLVEQEAAEYADLMTLEAASFEKVARVYFDHVYGAVANVEWLEKKARYDLEDDYNLATSVLLAQLREEIWLAEQRLFMRTLGMCPDALPHLSQLRIMAAEAEALRLSQMSFLDSREAIPLWNRVSVIRSETESEEHITFRRIILACAVQAHALEMGYVRYDTVTGHLRCTYRETPPFMKDALEYAMQFQPFALILQEETQRMKLVEEADEDFAALAAEAALEVNGNDGSS